MAGWGAKRPGHGRDGERGRVVGLKPFTGRSPEAVAALPGTASTLKKMEVKDFWSRLPLCAEATALRRKARTARGPSTTFCTVPVSAGVYPSPKAHRCPAFSGVATGAPWRATGGSP